MIATEAVEVTAPAPLLLTPEEAARVLRIGRTKLYELLRSGVLPSVTIGASRRVRVADLEELVQHLGGHHDSHTPAMGGAAVGRPS